MGTQKSPNGLELEAWNFRGFKCPRDEFATPRNIPV